MSTDELKANNQPMLLPEQKCEALIKTLVKSMLNLVALFSILLLDLIQPHAPVCCYHNIVDSFSDMRSHIVKVILWFKWWESSHVKS